MGWKIVVPFWRAIASNSSSLRCCAPGDRLLRDIRRQRRLRGDAARHFHAADDRLLIAPRGEVVRHDRWMRARIAGLQADRAAALRPELADRAGDAGIGMEVAAGLVHRDGEDVELDVRRREFGARLAEDPDLASADRQRPGALEPPFERGAEFLDRAAREIVESDRKRAAIDEADLEVILQTRADAGQVMHDFDAMLLQQRRGPDARELQHMRRIDRAAGHHDFAARGGDPLGTVLEIGDSGRALARDHDARGERVGLDFEIGAFAHRPQIFVGGAGAPAIAHRELVIAGTFLGRAVEILVARNPRGLGRRDESFADRMLESQIGDAQRTAGAVECIGAALLILGLLEIRQHVVIAPAGIAELAPMIEILRLAADIDEAVDRARTAEDLAARPHDLPAIDAGIRLGLEAPAQLRMHGAEIADGDMDPGIAVFRAGLEQQDAMARIGREPVGQDTARGAGADDDEIELFRGHVVPSARCSLLSEPRRRQKHPPRPPFLLHIHGGALSFRLPDESGVAARFRRGVFHIGGLRRNCSAPPHRKEVIQCVEDYCSWPVH